MFQTDLKIIQQDQILEGRQRFLTNTDAYGNLKFISNRNPLRRPLPYRPSGSGIRPVTGASFRKFFCLLNCIFDIRTR